MHEHAIPFDKILALLIGYALTWLGGYFMGRAAGRQAAVADLAATWKSPQTGPRNFRPLLEGREIRFTNPPNTSDARPPRPGGTTHPEVR